mgnify:FL=1
MKHFVMWLFIVSIVSATISGLTVALAKKPSVLAPGEVTVEELQKTAMILNFAERNCKKLGFRVEGSGAHVSVTCGDSRTIVSFEGHKK